MIGKIIFFGAIIFYSQAALAADYTLTGFKSMDSKKSPEKVKIYVEDKETGTCKVRGEIKTAALTNLMATTTPKFVGVHGDCNLAGFKFNAKRTFWFHLDSVIIANEEVWEKYLLQLGPNIDCSGANVANMAAAGNTKTASSLGFCGG